MDEGFRVNKLLALGVHAGDDAVRIFLEGYGSNRVGCLQQTDSLTWSEAEVVKRVDLTEVRAFNIDGLSEGNSMGTEGGFLREGHFDISS